ncbi:MAG: response regulator, partial [Anaerovibrio sp.]|nr:response regulator [Anaerovibrio sp.]
MSDTKTMLVADADGTSRRALVQIFQEKFLILEADNGRTVLDYLNSQPIHIVLLDMNLPVISTGELLTKFSASLLFKDIAIIVTGSSESEAIAVMADVTRAADFLQKPYHPAIARHRILNVLANQENEMCKLRQSAQDEKINKMQHIIDIDQLTGL